MQDLHDHSGNRAQLHIMSAKAPFNTLCSALWPGTHQDVSEVLLALQEALAGVLVGELHKHAMNEAIKGIMLPALPMFFAALNR